MIARLMPLSLIFVSALGVAQAGPTQTQADIPAVLQTLQTGDSKARKSAAEQLAIAAPSKSICDAFSAIADKLSDSDSGVRTWVAGILLECVISDPALASLAARQRTALLSGLSSPDPTERVMMLRLVVSLGDPLAGEFQSRVFELLHDPDRKVRLIAVSAVQLYKPLPSEVVMALDSMIENKDDDRGAAAQTLGEMKISDPRTIGLLETALQDKDRYVRQEAVRALMEIGHPAGHAVSALRVLANDPKTDDMLKKLANDAINAIQQ